MRRNWALWTVFGVALCTALAAMVWISLTVAKMESHSRHRDQVEENVRLALWRMDSWLATELIAQETARPYFAYSAFTPAERAYTRMFNEIGYGEVLVPSPLLDQQNPLVLLHFQIDPDGNVTSPQVPRGNMLDLARQHYVEREKVLEADKALQGLRTRLPPRDSFACAPPTPTPEPPGLTLANANNDAGQGFNNGSGTGGGDNRQQLYQQQVNAPAQQADQQQRNVAEFQARSMRSGSQSPNNYNTNRVGNVKAPLSHVREGVMTAQWIAPEHLVLARRVSVNREEYVQGVWLNWPEIRGRLLAEIVGLLPDARLDPVMTIDAPPEKQGRRLAAIPVKLEPGHLPMVAAAGLSPIRGALYTAWAGVVLGSIAVALLLWGTIRLSERRAAFVSAVTHELRTPLTTVSMYAEMLEQGMVQGERRQEYLSTLRAEASRLGHLVENVLAYSRIERSSAGSRIQTLTVPELIDGARQRLEERSKQVGLDFTISIDPAAGHASVRADASAVEQILFNLVDNAAKYASASSDKRLDLTATLNGTHALLRLRDHGPGIVGPQLKRLFQPFSKSAQDAAHSAPGVGLGLALSRRLAREMRGDLSLDTDCDAGGACFLLRLPLADPRHSAAPAASAR